MLCEGKVWRMIWTPVPVNHVQTLLWLWSFMPCLLPRMFDLRSIPILTFSLFFKKCVVYKSSNIHAYKKGDITEITMPCHTTTKFEISAQCAKQSRRQLVFFWHRLLFSISLTISKKFCRCVYHKGGTKNSFPLLSLKPIALLFCVSSM